MRKVLHKSQVTGPHLSNTLHERPERERNDSRVTALVVTNAVPEAAGLHYHALHWVQRVGGLQQRAVDAAGGQA